MIKQLFTLALTALFVSFFHVKAQFVSNNGQKGCKAGTAQVKLKTSFKTVSCSKEVADLNKLVIGAPPAGSKVVWFNSPVPIGEPIPDVFMKNGLFVGTYHAFYYDPTSQCYNTQNSTAKVNLIYQVALVSDSIWNNNIASSTATIKPKCPSTKVDLNTALWGMQSAMENSTLQWYDNKQHAGEQIADPKNAAPGTYYAFYKETTGANCFNTDIVGGLFSKVIVQDANCPVSSINIPGCAAGSNQVKLSKSKITNACPTNTANLSAAFNGMAPAGSALVWYNNPTHSGNAVTDSKKASTGTYYAFFYDKNYNCFNTDKSSAAVRVDNIRCTETPQQSMQLRTGAEELESFESTSDAIYPNPVSNELFINTADFQNVKKVTLTNSNGIEVYQSNEKPAQKINVSALTEGIYIVKIFKKDGKVDTNKVLIKK